MEAERQNLAEGVTAAERKYLDEKKRADELQQQVKVTKNQLESAKQELADYKQKATRILQVSICLKAISLIRILDFFFFSGCYSSSNLICFFFHVICNIFWGESIMNTYLEQLLVCILYRLKFLLTD